MCSSCAPRSPSSRRAWIEITCSSVQSPLRQVALLAEGVDRNPLALQKDPKIVASPSSRRAWIEISSTGRKWMQSTSPSSRRAWIEIAGRWEKGSLGGSPSSRRAWIEIWGPERSRRSPGRSPSSRRAWIEIGHPGSAWQPVPGRPPRGGRG